MVVASLIDVDERLIPDEVTVPGTLLGLLFAALLPWLLLPIMFRCAGGGTWIRSARVEIFDIYVHRRLAALGRRFERLGGRTWLRVAVVHRIDAAIVANEARIPPRGPFCGHACARPAYTVVLAIGMAVSIGVIVTWRIGGDYWRGLLSSLVGMAAGGGLIWIVRIIGKAVWARSDGLRRCDAVGDDRRVPRLAGLRGDFLSGAIAGAATASALLLMRRQNEIRYGPFLCLAAS